MILQFQALIADTIGAFNTGFDTVNLLPRSTPSSWQAEGLYCEQRLERRIEHDFYAFRVEAHTDARNRFVAGRADARNRFVAVEMQ